MGGVLPPPPKISTRSASLRRIRNNSKTILPENIVHRCPIGFEKNKKRNCVGPKWNSIPRPVRRKIVIKNPAQVAGEFVMPTRASARAHTTGARVPRGVRTVDSYLTTIIRTNRTDARWSVACECLLFIRRFPDTATIYYRLSFVTPAPRC